MSEENDNVAPTNNENDILMGEEEVIQETAGNETENQDTSRNEIVEKMLKEILEKQKNFETSLVDKLRSVESELQLIRDDLKPKTVTAAAPVKADNENITAWNSENKSVTMSTTGKYFMLKHVFKNVSNMKENVDHWSEAEEHYGVKWRMYVRRTKEHLQFYLNCSKPTGTVNWTIETQRKQVLVSNRVENKVAESIGIFDKESRSWGWTKFIEWKVLEQDFLVDGKLTAEIHVKIEKTAGIYKDNLRNFDETMEEFSDIVLVLNEENFYVLKLYLAAHSPYFKALFLGQFQESKKSEIKLTGIDADDFQNYLELLYGEHPIDEYTCEGLLLVADMLDTPLVRRKCEKFLLEKTEKTLKKKLELSARYNLETLKKKCLAEIKSIDDLQDVLPGNVQDLDKSLIGELLEKSISLHN